MNSYRPIRAQTSAYST